MPLPSPVERTLHHRRAVSIDAYARADGLWDLEACLTDTRTSDYPLATGMRPAGQPIHQMQLRVTIDTAMNIVDASACSDWVPYPGYCDTIGDAYRLLIGLNLLNNFRRQVKDRLNGIHGCTHLTELCGVLPTAAIQAFAGRVFSTQDVSDQFGQTQQMPFQLNRCHALRTDGEAVKRFYPSWHGRPLEPSKMGAIASSRSLTADSES